MEYLNILKQYNILTDAKSYILTNNQKKELVEEYKKISGKNVYFIHYNYDKPYKVELYDNIVKVYDRNNKDNLTVYDNTEKIFIGKSPKNEMTINSGNYGKEFDGNTFLISLKNGNYVYIGALIYEFKPESEIVEYVSPIGNNDVPYPYAIDRNNNYYLIIENVIIKPPEKTEDVYKYYYDNHELTKTKFKGITEFFANNEKLFYTYQSFPEKNYDRLLKDFGELEIVKNGKRRKLSKKEYVKINNDFGKKHKFKAINIL